MISASVLVASLGCYAAVLFAVGWWTQRRAPKDGWIASLFVALSIGVYCTSWTFYGAVGTAARSGWDYLPIYLGPILAFTLGLGLIRRTVALGKAHGATSLPDLLSRRFGRSARLAALVTFTALIVSIPYIALQLIAVASTFAELTGSGAAGSPLVVVGVGIVLMGFGLVFGTRNRDITKANKGLVGAIAFESLFKLAAFVFVAVIAWSALSNNDMAVALPAPEQAAGLDRFVVLTLLSAFAVLCLPRQFHMTVVEARSERQVAQAAPLVAIYLALFAVLVLPVVAAGSVVAPGSPPDLFVLRIPEALGLNAVALIAFAGGFAAASGMIIVAGVALSTMVATDLVLPVLSRRGGGHVFANALLIRRVTLCLVIAAAAVFALMAPRDAGLASFGVVSFSGAAQFAPLLLAALFVPRATEQAALAGLTAGVLAWVMFVLGPTFFEGSMVDGSPWLANVLPFFSDDFTRGTVAAFVLNGSTLAAVSQASPPRLKDRQDAARFAAMSPTLLTDGRVSIGDLQELLVQIIGEGETRAFLSHQSRLAADDPAPATLIAEAETKLSRVLGNTSAHILVGRLLAKGRIEAGDVMVLMGEASRELRFGQELLATTLENLAEGVSVIDSEGRLAAWNKTYTELFDYPESLLRVGLPIEELFRHNLPHATESEVQRRVSFLLEGKTHNQETRLRDGRILRLQGRPVPGGGYVTSFSDVTEYRQTQNALAESEQATRFYTENIPFPIGFSDRSLVLRFHNKAFATMAEAEGADLTGRRLEELFGDLYQYRETAIDGVLKGETKRFVLSPEEIGGTVTWQVTYVPQVASDGSVDGFFAFYQDISVRRAAQAALEKANKSLETRVAQRTAELERANANLDTARQEAEAANRSKTRFLAAASHDVLQPLNAARLFASSLEDDLPDDGHLSDVAHKIGTAIVSADTLLRSLLNLSKLEAGGVDPQIEDLDLGPYLTGIADEFRPLAEEKGLSLRVAKTTERTRTDPGLLRSALQNLISNALRYTDHGGVVLGVRRRGGELSIEVADSGRGIATDDIPQLFEEFRRLKRDRDIEGAGLGLATVSRVAQLLGHDIDVTSELDRGTVFRVSVPRIARRAEEPASTVMPKRGLEDALVVCVDNDRPVLDALRMRFERWGARVEVYPSLGDLRVAYRNGREKPDLTVLDYQLDDGETGLDVLTFLREEKGYEGPVVFVTASPASVTDDITKMYGAPVLQKPVEPAALRALSVSLLTAQTD